MIVKRSGLAELSAGNDSVLPEGSPLPRPAMAERLAELRDTLARIGTDGGHFAGGSDDSHFRLGGDVPEPCLRRAALHEITAREAGDGAAALAFALALALKASEASNHRQGRILIVLEGMAGQETGLPYGHGLAALGLDPQRLLLLSTSRAVEALWAIEEGLRSAALVAVVGVFARLPRVYDLTASRRLVLAARHGGLPACLAIIGEGGASQRLASAAETRWQIAARPSARGVAGEPTSPAFNAELLRRRGGEPATFNLDWNHDTRSFIRRVASTPLSLPVVAISSDRPRQAARTG
jgi:protein ImuA